MVTSADLAPAERLKFRLLAGGVAITDRATAYIGAVNGGRAMTPADYASTSGIILALEDSVWVNAPIRLHNPNFVTTTAFTLDSDGPEGPLVVRGEGLSSTARFWLPPAYHDGTNAEGERYTDYAFTHADRVRISPIAGCHYTCKFCDLPYEFRYRTKRVEGLHDAVRVALSDPVQPAAHVLISGGTPRDSDIGYLRDVYESVILGFPDVSVDVMMVPIDELLDPAWLDRIGVNELSVNLEIYNRDVARHLMRRKADQGLDYYLDYLEKAAEIMGPGRVRSMLMVGLEPMEDTLAGVRAIAARGADPVLSPFRPDPATPLRDRLPPDARLLEETYLRSLDIVRRENSALGPKCLPCTHNTLTLVRTSLAGASSFGNPHLI